MASSAGWRADGQFRFVLKVDNADTLLTSELYHTKGSADSGMASVKSSGMTKVKGNT